MADEATTTTAAETDGTTTTTETEDQRVPYERFQQANKKAKEAADQAKALQKQMDELRSQLEERESAGLPELERERKRAEQLEQRIADAEARAAQAEERALNTERSRWVAKAAASQNFIDPDDATRFVDLADIESADDAERAVKKVAKAKAHLIRPEETKLPGQVLANGRTTSNAAARPGGIDPAAEADTLAESLKQFLKNRSS